MLKRLIVLMIMIIALFSCAKKSTEGIETHALSLTAQIPTVGNPLDIDITDTQVFIAEDQCGISVVKLSDYTKKWFTGMLNSDGSIQTLKKIKKVSFLPSLNWLLINETDGSDQILLANTADPDTLKFVSTTIGGTSGTQEMKFTAYADTSNHKYYEGYFCGGRSVSYGNYGAFIEGVPAYFVITNTIEAPSNVMGFFVKDALIYVAASQRGLLIYNRTTGLLVGECDLPGEAQKVKVMGDYAYVTCRQEGLQIVDISDPATPVKVSKYDTAGYATNLDVWTNNVAVSSGAGGIYVINVTNPLNPFLRENVTSCGYVNNVKYNQNKLFVAARDQGLLVYNILP